MGSDCVWQCECECCSWSLCARSGERDLYSFVLTWSHSLIGDDVLFIPCLASPLSTTMSKSTERFSLFGDERKEMTEAEEAYRLHSTAMNPDYRLQPTVGQ